jgi:hypothetical protein
VPWGRGSRPHARPSRSRHGHQGKHGEAGYGAGAIGRAAQIGQPACVRRMARGEWARMAVRRGGPTARGPMGAGRPRRAVRRRVGRHACARVATSHASARSGAGSAGSISINPFPLRKTPYFLTEVNKVINSKVVDLLILYHFHKGRIAFFSTFSAQFGCQDAEFLGSSVQ